MNKRELSWLDFSVMVVMAVVALGYSWHNLLSHEAYSENHHSFDSGLIITCDDTFNGLVENEHAYRNSLGKESAAFRPSQLPSFHTLEAFMPPAINQGNTTRCVSFTMIYIKGFHEVVEEYWDPRQDRYTFCPDDIHRNIAVSIDKGARIDRGFEYLKTHGGLLSGSSNNHRYKIYDYFGVVPSEIDRLKSLLAGGIPLVISVRSIPALKRHRGTGVLDTYDPTPQDRYHALTVIGYDDRRGGGAFRIQNSWGQHWGDGQGRAWISYSLFEKITQHAYYAIDAPNGPRR